MSSGGSFENASEVRTVASGFDRLHTHRDVFVRGGGRLRLRRGHVGQVLDHLLRVLRFARAGLARAQDRLVLAVCGVKKMGF